MKTKEGLNKHELLLLVSNYEKLVEILREELRNRKSPGDGELNISLYSVGGGGIDGSFDVNNASGYILGYAAYLLGASFRDAVADSPEAWKNPDLYGLIEVIKMNFLEGIDRKGKTREKINSEIKAVNNDFIDFNLTEKQEKEK